MIPRYSRPEMVAIWSPETSFRIWFEIEAHACDALAELGVIPKEAAKTIWEKGGAATFDVERIDEIERVTKHDVIAFLTHLAEIVGPDARFVHQGMTSSDVLDTCFAVQLARAADILLADLDALLAALKKRAFEHKDTLTIGRSHGIHAEPTTFGLKLAQAYAEFAAQPRAAGRGPRGDRDLRHLRRRSAPSPTSIRASRSMSPRSSGSTLEPVSTQVIPRDRHAMFFATLGVIASSIERLATEIRHLQRTEVLEAEEYLLAGPEGLVGDAAQAQPGADREPHRPRPPGARLSSMPALENVALWHERDISHSSVERMIGPDATVTLDFALARLTGVIDKLVVYPEQHAEEPRPARRPGPFAARAAGADPGRRQPRGRLPPRSSATP